MRFSFTKYYSSGEIKTKYTEYMAHKAHMRRTYMILVGKPKGNDRLEDLEDGRIPNKSVGTAWILWLRIGINDGLL